MTFRITWERLPDQTWRYQIFQNNIPVWEGEADTLQVAIREGDGDLELVQAIHRLSQTPVTPNVMRETLIGLKEQNDLFFEGETP